MPRQRDPYWGALHPKQHRSSRSAKAWPSVNTAALILGCCMSLRQLLRCWGHINGFGTKQKTKYPIQPRLGVYSEDALRRYDFVLDQLSKVCCGHLP